MERLDGLTTSHLPGSVLSSNLFLDIRHRLFVSMTVKSLQVRGHRHVFLFPRTGCSQEGA